MTELDVVKIFYDELAGVSLPAEYAGTVGAGPTQDTIADVGLTDGADDGWRWGIVSFTSGAATGVHRMVYSSDATTLTLMDRLPAAWVPSPGDTFRVWGGYLSEATLYKHEPEVIRDPYSVVLLLDKAVRPRRTLGRQERKVLTNRVDMRVLCEAAYSMGVGAAAEETAQQAAYLLTEQVAHILGFTRYQSENQGWGVGQMELDYGFNWRPAPDVAHQVRRVGIVKLTFATVK